MAEWLVAKAAKRTEGGLGGAFQESVRIAYRRTLRGDPTCSTREVDLEERSEGCARRRPGGAREAGRARRCSPVPPRRRGAARAHPRGSLRAAAFGFPPWLIVGRPASRAVVRLSTWGARPGVTAQAASARKGLRA